MNRAPFARLLAAALACSFAAGCTNDLGHGPMPAAAVEDGNTPEPFMNLLPSWGRYILLDQLHDVVPPYLEQTRAVLDQIDALPEGTVDETTKLDQVPIPDLFAPGQEVLSQVLYDADFEGGRTDHDVAWLRQSADELQALEDVVAEAIQNGYVAPAGFDDYLSGTGYWTGEDGAFWIEADIAAVSRFYCNLGIHIEDEGAGGPFLVEAAEYCD